MKMTSNERLPQNIKSGISQRPLWGLWLMKLEENSDEISSLALLSPACSLFMLWRMLYSSFGYGSAPGYPMAYK
jgi:hypothetical protein